MAAFARTSRILRSTLAIGAALAAGPALAQEVDHSKMDHSKMDHSTMHHPAPQEAEPAEDRPNTQSGPDARTPDDAGGEHAGHAGHAAGGLPARDAEPVDHPELDHSGMDHSGRDHSGMDHSKMDHSGMDHSKMDHSPASRSPGSPAGTGTSAADHSGMNHSTPMDHSKHETGHARRSTDPQQPVEPIPSITEADRRAAFPDLAPHPAHGDSIHSYFLANRLETWDADPGTGMAWEAQGWIGKDLERLWIRTEGERTAGETESADLELLYGRSVSPWWDVVAGVRHDFKPGASQSHLALGVMGLAPQKFEVQATAYLSEHGRVSARIEAEYEMLLTNRLILQPLVEASLQGRNDPARGIGAGLETVEAGLRLRYEITRRFAPYVGVVRERAFGRTADYRRESGESVDDTHVVFGLRVWF